MAIYDSFDPENGAHLLLLCSTGILAVVIVILIFKRDPEKPVLFTVPIPEQCDAGWKGEVLENPSIKISGSAAVQAYNPANGHLLGVVNSVTADGIDRAISRAKEAQVGWAKTTWSQRRRWLRTLKRFILDNQSAIVKVACLDSGKTSVDAYFGEILVTLEKIDWTLRHGEKALKPERRPTNLLMCYKVNEVRWESMGVVGAAVSWNYPFHNLLGPIISSLFAGNSVVVKPSERTAWSSAWFTSVVRASLVACGHSKDLVQACVCWPSVAPHLVSHPEISHFTFIGSRKVAHAVSEAASKSLVPLCLELGGKDATIILDDVADNDAELERIAAILARGVFQAAGQNCVGIERIIALPKVYPKLLQKLEAIVRGLRVGDPSSDAPVDVGACISEENFSLLEELVDDAVFSGAHLVVGGRRAAVEKAPQGHYFEVTMLADVTDDMKIAQHELFAPIMTVMPASSVDDAIRIANSTPYGLGSSVFGRDLTQLQKVTEEVKTGMVAVNDFAAYYAVQLPFGGVKGSGYGRFAGTEGLRSVCNVKSVCRDRFSFIKTTIPRKLQLPYGGLLRFDSKNPRDHTKQAELGAEAVVRGVVELGYGDSYGRRLTGLRSIIGI